jgi:DNA processing protein
MLYLKGRREVLQRPAIAVVGSRRCSAAGVQLADMFAQRLGEAGYLIVSGLARGIDGAAHRAALQSGTAAVVAGGVDMVYPPEHQDLHEQIAAEGCLVSEQPPGFKARGQDFPRRNRIIAGISLGVVIVEAAARSGTLVTARYAGEQGRDVFAVPGHPLDPRAEGTNRLIKTGATLVTDAQDVLDALEPMTGLRGGLAAPPWRPMEVAPASFGTPAPTIGAKEHRLVLDALGPAPADLDAIINATGLSARAVQIALMELDLAGHIVRPGPGLIALRPG